MSVALSDLITRAQGLASARDGVPSAAQYTQAVKDGVMEYARRCPNKKVATLSIVSGTAAYALPSDFLFLTQVGTLANPSGVIVSDAGLIPVNANWQERWYVTGRTITFYPTPTYSISRDVWYAAGHVLNTAGEYADLLEEEATIALLKAQAICLSIKANKAADDAWSYGIGDERVSKEKLRAELQAQAEELEGKFEEAVEKRIGVVGTQVGEADYQWYAPTL